MRCPSQRRFRQAPDSVLWPASTPSSITEMRAPPAEPLRQGGAQLSGYGLDSRLLFLDIPHHCDQRGRVDPQGIISPWAAAHLHRITTHAAELSDSLSNHLLGFEERWLRNYPVTSFLLDELAHGAEDRENEPRRDPDDLPRLLVAAACAPALL